MQLQAHDGSMGFLPGHAPLIAELGIGELKLVRGGSTEYMVVEGGIVEIRDNQLIVLAETAFEKADLDKAELEAKLSQLVAQKDGLAKFSDERSQIILEQEKIKARIKVAVR